MEEACARHPGRPRECKLFTAIEYRRLFTRVRGRIILRSVYREYFIVAPSETAIRLARKLWSGPLPTIYGALDGYAAHRVLLSPRSPPERLPPRQQHRDEWCIPQRVVFETFLANLQNAST